MKNEFVKKIVAFLSCFMALSLSSCASKSNPAQRDLISPNAIQLPGDTWNGEIDESWFSTDSDSYFISTAQQFAGLANLVNTGYSSFFSKRFYVDCDIYLNDITNFSMWNDNPPANVWRPIGTDNYPFRGVIDFQGHVVAGMYIDDTVLSSNPDAGLFGLIQLASPDSPIYVSNLQLLNSMIKMINRTTLVENVGSVVGRIINGGVYGKINGLANIISDCRIISKIETIKYLGGISGYTQANIFNSGFTGEFELKNCSAKIGGISSGGAVPSYIVNSYSSIDLTELNIKATESGVISYQSMPIHCFYQKTTKFNKNNYAFGYVRRVETNATFLPHSNGFFEDLDGEVIISDVTTRWNGNSGLYGDNAKPTELISYDCLLNALNSFTAISSFSKELEKEGFLKKWVRDNGINGGFPINYYDE